MRSGSLAWSWAKCALLAVGALLLYLAVEQRRGSWARGVLVTSLVCGLLAARSLLLVRPVIGTLVLLSCLFPAARALRPRAGGCAISGHCRCCRCFGPIFRACRRSGPRSSAPTPWPPSPLRSAVPPALGPSPVKAALGLAPWARARWLLATLAACALATFITPFGVRGATLPALLLERLLPGEHDVFARTVAENLSPFVLEGVSGGELWHFKWSLAIRRGVRADCRSSLQAQPRPALAGLRWSCGAEQSQCAALLLARGPHSGAQCRASAVARGSAALPTARAAGGSGAQRRARWRAVQHVGSGGRARVTAFGVEPVSGARPRAHGAWRPCPGGGKVFCADHQGGYLIWQLYPRFRPYIDTRLVLRTADEYAAYLRLADEPERFEAFQARHGFAYVVLPVLFPDRYQRLIAHLYQSAEWKLLYTDGSEVLFGRRDLTRRCRRAVADRRRRHREDLGGVAAALRRACRKCTPPRGSAWRRCTVLSGSSTPRDARLAGAGTPEARALEARLHFAAGELDIAQQLARQGLASDHDDVRSLNLMALIALRRGDAARVWASCGERSAFDRSTPRRRNFWPNWRRVDDEITSRKQS